MGLLTSFPHTCNAYKRTISRDEYGGTFETNVAVFTNRNCWQQQASSGEIADFDKAGKSGSCKVYFLTDPELDEQNTLVVTNNKTGQTYTFDVKSDSVPDASAGLGVVYKVMVEHRSTRGE